MEGSDENGVMQRIQSSFGNNCSSSSVVGNQGISHEINVINNNVQLLNNNVQFESNYGKKPPSYPHSQFTAVPQPTPSKLSVGGGGGQRLSEFSVKPSHTRSVSQPSFVSFDQLPPLSPSMFKESSTTSSSDRVSIEANNVQGLSLPPRGRGHRRSCSDVPLGFVTTTSQSEKPAQLVMKREAEWGGGGKGGGGELVDDLFSTYMNFDGMDVLNSSSMEDKDSRASGTRTNESSENEGESSGISSNSVDRKERGKRSATGDIAPTGRHSRSLSMDSFMGNLNLYDGSPSISPSPGGRVGQHSRSNSMDGNTSLFSLEFGNGEFSPEELKKIMANEKLAEVAKVDPKRVKRILANRVSAARSKERKVRYIAELEYKVQTLQTEATSLSAQLTFLQRDAADISAQNNELRFRLQAMEQQGQLRDALMETLRGEVERLKITAQIRGINLTQQVMPNNQAFQIQPSHNMHQSQQIQKQSGPTQNEQSRQGGES